MKFVTNNLYKLDLRDDFLMNSSKKLYEFLENDPVKAFHLGIHISKWFELLDKGQQYLHSKSLRHNQEDIEPYMDQIKYWTEKYSNNYIQNGKIDMIELSEYIYNHIIWNNEDIDKIKVALFLGMVVGRTSNIDDENLSYNVH